MDTRHPSIARADASLLLIVDCQERLWKVIHESDVLAGSIATLARGACMLEVPTLVTEQYPKGLGPTVTPVKDACGDAAVVTKDTFSCWGEPSFVDPVREGGRTTLIVTGIEAHVCVQQTALDGLAEGYAVQVVADAVGSRDPANRAVALRRLEQAGAVITCVESVLFDWMERCDHPTFKDVQGLLK